MSVTSEQFEALREDLRAYHGDVKRRLTVVEDRIEQHNLAIVGRPGDDTCPGLNLHVN